MEAVRPLRKSRWSTIMTIEDLPDDILHLLFTQYLKVPEALAFSYTCKKFSRFFYRYFTKRHLNIENNYFSLGIPYLNSFLIHHVYCSLLKTCNFQGCYWIPNGILESFLARCVNLEKLSVAGTEITLVQIINRILPKCRKITSLSLSLSKSDHIEDCTKEDLKRLENLKSLQLVVADGCMLPHLLDFLRKCVNLKELMVLRAPGQITSDVPRVTLPHLESLIFVSSSWPAVIAHNPFNVQISRLNTFWTNVFDGLEDSSTEEKHEFISLCWNGSPLFIEVEEDDDDFEQPVPASRFSALTSITDPTAILMKLPESSKQLKQVNCYYDGESFPFFCENHKQIEILTLNDRYELVIHGVMGQASPLVWNLDSWKHLSNLRILSITAELIPEPKSGKPYASFPYMAAVIQSCNLEELEILGPYDLQKPVRWKIHETELAAIAQCVSLKRLTLSNLVFDKGQFLEEILRKCPRLRSLRLFNLGGRQCCYLKSLRDALPSATNLKTFCMFQNHVTLPEMKTLVETLKKCASLSRVSLVWPVKPWQGVSEIDFSDMFFKLCCELKQLVAIFGVFNVPSRFCESTNRILRDHFIQLRQAFRCDLQTLSDEHAQSRVHSHFILPRFPRFTAIPSRESKAKSRSSHLNVTHS